MESVNFAFLEGHEPLLYRLTSLAEALFTQDPNTSLLKSRQFGEAVAKQIAAHSNRTQDFPSKQVDLLNALQNNGLLPKSIADMLHFIRKRGNEANHELKSTANDALACLRFAQKVSLWYVRAYRKLTVDPSLRFVPPPTEDPAEDLKAQLGELTEELSAAQKAQAVSSVRLDAIKRDRERLLEAAKNQTAELEELQAELARLRAEALSEGAPTEAQLSQAASQAADQVELNEADTRDLIDSALEDAGWRADHRNLSYSRGTRPQPGQSMAIAEWPTKSGPVDYALFVGEACVGVIEAKRKSKDVPGVLAQAERYARDLDYPHLVDGAPYEGAPRDAKGDFSPTFKVPFAFATNGRPHVKQLKEKSGIWYRDLRSSMNHPRDLPAWHSPGDLLSKLEQEPQRSEKALAEEPFDYANLRYYQRDAITAIEEAIGEGRDTALISMATGTGKTRMAIALMYRALKHRRFRRILFLVDRNALAEQTKDGLANTELEGLLKFTDTYSVIGPDDGMPDEDTRVHVATVQSMVARVFRSSEGRPTPGMYDLVIVDEAHRGYALDGELSDEDIEFRSTEDYLSKYRRVLDYFDAVKVGLTATPALQTTEIFGAPVYRYSYRQAVVDGYLTDHLPPKRIVTALNTAGITFKGGEEVSILDPSTGAIDTATLPDDLGFEVQQFNKRVYTEPFNRVVAQTIASEVPPDEDGKTLIFAARDDHADLLVRLLNEELKAEYGDDAVPNDLVMKITGQTDRAGDAIRRYRSDARPKYVVTVDMLSTGVDIPKITNLVFVRRVNSRILYDQMIGRATRLCPEINKTEFRIFDAVDLYDNLQSMTDMRPVVTNPHLSFTQLAADLANAPDEASRKRVQEQIVAKVRRREPRLTDKQAETLEDITGENAAALADKLQKKSSEELVAYLEAHPRIIATLDEPPAKGRRPGVPISEHEDELIAIEDIFKNDLTPEDYIEAFERYIRDNLNASAGMIAATQKPRELTRQSLKELALALDEENFSYPMLRAAYGKARNADIAAHILGFVRQAALGDPLVPYETRVQNAVDRSINSRSWTPEQRQWLKRIGNALKEHPVADRETLAAPAFQHFGGWSRSNQAFDGELESVLGDINEAVWSAQDTG